MAGAEIQELVPRLLQLAQALATQPDALKGELDQLLQAPANLAERVESAVADQIRQARKQLDDAVASTQAEADRLQTQLNEVKQQVAAAKSAADQSLTGELQRATELEAAAGRAHEQALGLIEAASDTAAAARRRADDTLQAAQDQAEQLRQEATKAAQAAKDQADAVETSAKKELDDALAKAAEAVSKLQQQLPQIEQQVRAEVEQRLGQAGAIPGQVEALADDARARLTKALEFPAGILSLTAQGLCWLKGRFFAQEDRLRVIRYTPAPGTHGLGLTWVDAGATLLLAYAADHPTESGSFTVKLDGGTNDPVSFGPPGVVTITVSGAGDQAIVIGPGAPPPAPGNDHLTITATFTALGWNWDADVVQANAAAPTLTIDLRHDGSWKYSVSLEVKSYGLALKPSAALGKVGVPLPVPDLQEQRKALITIENGNLLFREGAAA